LVTLLVLGGLGYAAWLFREELTLFLRSFEQTPTTQPTTQSSTRPATLPAMRSANQPDRR
jgi:hypothetical protein